MEETYLQQLCELLWFTDVCLVALVLLVALFFGLIVGLALFRRL